MDYKVTALNRYLMDIPEEFKRPSKEEEVYKLEGEHEVTVSCNKLTKEALDNMKQYFPGLGNNENVQTKNVEVKVLEDLVRDVDDNVQHFIHTTSKSEDSITGNWLFFEQVEDDFYTVSVEYDHEDQEAQEISSKIINSIVKWRH